MKKSELTRLALLGVASGLFVVAQSEVEGFEDVSKEMQQIIAKKCGGSGGCGGLTADNASNKNKNAANTHMDADDEDSDDDVDDSDDEGDDEDDHGHGHGNHNNNRKPGSNSSTNQMKNAPKK